MTDADDPFLGSDYVLIFASRDDIQAGDIQPILGPLNALLRQDVASRMRHKVRFGVNGYDDDPRALYDIPEVQSWMRKLDQEWPYWFFFLSPGNIRPWADHGHSGAIREASSWFPVRRPRCFRPVHRGSLCSDEPDLRISGRLRGYHPKNVRRSRGVLCISWEVILWGCCTKR